MPAERGKDRISLQKYGRLRTGRGRAALPAIGVPAVTSGPKLNVRRENG
ncbi:hypothetical protein B4135_0511 [Caldibacillus debilis]|uniref:Uncharacterized protein n=1 Tax=Caldibacillus debilis TaxID=301148 RepID=A0A150L9X7_9BACI|nr:hypothetical protein B4135_0511 [Caldibacillus debilis]